MPIRNAGVFLLLCSASVSAATLPYEIVDTGQEQAYGMRRAIALPASDDQFFGQDASYGGNAPSYRDNGNGTVSDLVTGLMWTQDPGDKVTYAQAQAGAAKCRVGGYSDWRLPSIKELYSLVQFDGTDPDPRSQNTAQMKPFIDDVFAFRYGDPGKHERIIDSQFATSTRYVSTTMNGALSMFGVNFADGRIKGYPVISRRNQGQFHVLYVRGNPAYGENGFVDNGDGTITDEATGLTWMQDDSGAGMNWPDALKYAENLGLGGHSDWRLPNAKELQSIIDYTRSPDTHGSAAIDPIFNATPIKNEGANPDFASYWTGTTHVRASGDATAAVYLSFGRGLGYMRLRNASSTQLMDVHGAGSQRSDPKVGNASRYSGGRGPQGDVVRIENFVRCVRGGSVAIVD